MRQYSTITRQQVLELNETRKEAERAFPSFGPHHDYRWKVTPHVDNLLAIAAHFMELFPELEMFTHAREPSSAGEAFDPPFRPSEPQQETKICLTKAKPKAAKKAAKRKS